MGMAWLSRQAASASAHATVPVQHIRSVLARYQVQGTRGRSGSTRMFDVRATVRTQYRYCTRGTGTFPVPCTDTVVLVHTGYQAYYLSTPVDLVRTRTSTYLSAFRVRPPNHQLKIDQLTAPPTMKNSACIANHRNIIVHDCR